mgnify:FL=1
MPDVLVKNADYVVTVALRAINNPDTVARLKEMGAGPAPMGVAPFEKFWKAEIEYWRPIVLDPAIELEPN